MIYREFRDAGLRVFGVHPIINGKCGCGDPECKAAGKHPLTNGWMTTPVWSDEQFQVLAEEMEVFKSGYGVLCQGLLVIDVDARNGGVESFERLRHDVPEVEKAGLIVTTGSGGGSRHLYFKVAEGVALISHHPDYPGLDFKSSGFVIGPGSLHASGNHYEAAYGSVDDIDDAPEALLALLRKPERHRASTGNGGTMDVSHADLADMISHVEPDADHETWVRCGMALHHASAGTAFAVWDDWSNRGTKYPGRDALTKRWHSFGKSVNPVTLGTLIHYAEAAGWKAPVTFETAEEFSIPATVTNLDISHIDTSRPPGFVGAVAEWIESQSYRPRQTLAVAAALTAIGNIGGLRYIDDVSGVSTNLFTFCVAGSGTGKEPIQQAMAAVMKAARVHQAVHGSIKSEQEIVRNLIDHQAAFFIIDEIGIFLKKVKNAQQKGGAAYLDGVIGILMSAYSKANGFMLITGDLKKEIRKALQQELQRLENADTQTGTIRARSASVRRALESIDEGIERPFLSLAGFTTPSTFEELVDFDNATNGFIGRALLFHERDTVPPHKKGFKQTPMSADMAQALHDIFAAGNCEVHATGRVEFYGQKTVIPTTPEGVALLDRVSDAFEELAVDYSEGNGLEGLALRAYEQVAKVSLILAIPGGMRTAEHILWAYALVRKDVDQKAKLVTANARAKDSPLLALRARLSTLCAGEEGATFGVICNSLRSHKKEDIEKCLAQMVKERLMVEIKSQHRFKKSVVVRRFKSVG
jgi:hypothetical protein